MKPQNDCWTCKARRVRCDGGTPSCNKCAQAGRHCQGYGTRLSWPRDNDKRRAITASSPCSSTTLSPIQIARLYFINTTWQDMELYRDPNLLIQPLHPVRVSPRPNPKSHPGASYMDLFNYFRDSAHFSLVTFDMNTSQTRDTLMRMALTSGTDLGLALFYSLLAFSALHRDGFSKQAMQLKIAAIRCLSAFTKEEPMTSAEAAQHVATSMLLGAFDILLPSATSGEWLWYTQGAMDIVQATYAKGQLCESDFGPLLGWVYFHDSLSRFPMHHWQHASLAREIPGADGLEIRGVPYPPLARRRPAMPPPKPSYVILNILSEACDTLLNPRDPRTHSTEYHERLKALESRIGGVHVTTDPGSTTAETALAVEIFRLATKVYLARATQSPWEAYADVELLIDKAFSGPVVHCACPHFFPLFILACEARADHRRTAILNLIDSTKDNRRIRNKSWLKDAIQTVWVHQDLHANSELLVNYVDIMSNMVSSSKYIPSFA
ncbi:fungal-specific transcription factor domain-containing protein [Hypoxylon sp. FL1284]|nr:fungal-specific transcription factor domain-containing protein [Hypoxylon sp. FL1284]